MAMKGTVAIAAEDNVSAYTSLLDIIFMRIYCVTYRYKDSLLEIIMQKLILKVAVDF